MINAYRNLALTPEDYIEELLIFFQFCMIEFQGF